MTSHAACPVVVVRGQTWTGATRPVVVGVDGTEVNEAAIAFAFRAAADRDVSLVAVHSWWDTFLDPGLDAQLFRDEDQVYEQELLSERLSGWSEKYPQVKVRRVVVPDRPAHVLIQHSRQAQLVLAGSRGHGEFTGLVLGSVSNALVHQAACPVAIVRAGSSTT